MKYFMVQPGESTNIQSEFTTRFSCTVMQMEIQIPKFVGNGMVKLCPEALDSELGEKK